MPKSTAAPLPKMESSNHDKGESAIVSFVGGREFKVAAKAQNTPASPRLDQFTCFLKLVQELRDMIWRFSIPERALLVGPWAELDEPNRPWCHKFFEYAPCTSQAARNHLSLPAVAQSCREARKAYLRFVRDEAAWFRPVHYTLRPNPGRSRRVHRQEDDGQDAVAAAGDVHGVRQDDLRPPPTWSGPAPGTLSVESPVALVNVRDVERIRQFKEVYEGCSAPSHLDPKVVKHLSSLLTTESRERYLDLMRLNVISLWAEILFPDLHTGGTGANQFLLTDPGTWRRCLHAFTPYNLRQHWVRDVIIPLVPQVQMVVAFKLCDAACHVGTNETLGKAKDDCERCRGRSVCLRI
ncbi:hypothetical protein PG997_007527 [Apiospora hydei]|uniref:2EXR domain-containing protein n=1 Tax=Apiospora hydei TaxID=1337664 RepID=A0ABR1W8A0_9PEZI